MAPRIRGDAPDDGDDPRLDVEGDVTSPTADDAANDQSEPTDGPDVGEVRQAATRARALDGRTLAVCGLVAVIAALVAALVVARLTDEDGVAEASAPGGGLRRAEEVPDLTFERFDGSMGSFADYRGQALVVNFWKSTCVPCVREMPDFQRVHTSLGDEVTFLGVDVIDDPDDAEAFADEAGVTYELIRDPDGSISRAFAVDILPVTALVAPDGTIIDTHFGRISADRLCDKINQSLLGGSVTECG